MKSVKGTPRYMVTCLAVGDSFTASILSSSNEAITTYTGEIPDFLVRNYSDSLELHIDLHTGQILNWGIPDNEDLADLCGFKKIKPTKEFSALEHRHYGRLRSLFLCRSSDLT